MANLCHLLSLSEADYLFSSANHLDILDPTKRTVPYLDRLALHPDANHREFILPADQCTLHTSDSDFSYLLDPSCIRFVSNQVSLELTSRKQHTLTADDLDDPFSDPPPPPNPAKAKRLVFRYLDWQEAAQNRTIFPFTTRAGRAFYALLLGFDLLPKGFPQLGCTTILKLPRSFHRFFDKEEFYQASISRQVLDQWEKGWSIHMAQLPSRIVPPIESSEARYICSYALGHQSPYHRVNKDHTYRGAVTEIRTSKVVETIESSSHAALTAKAYGADAQLRTHRLIPSHHLENGPRERRTPPDNTGPNFRFTFSLRPTPSADQEMHRYLLSLHDGYLIYDKPAVLPNPDPPSRLSKHQLFAEHGPKIMTITGDPRVFLAHNYLERSGGKLSVSYIVCISLL